MTDIQQRALEHAGSKLFRIRELVEHEPRRRYRYAHHVRLLAVLHHYMERSRDKMSGKFLYLTSIVALTFGVPLALQPVFAAADQSIKPVVCMEDEPCWQCDRMGNFQCGADNSNGLPPGDYAIAKILEVRTIA